jgi:hypothetical protein
MLSEFTIRSRQFRDMRQSLFYFNLWKLENHKMNKGKTWAKSHKSFCVWERWVELQIRTKKLIKLSCQQQE